MEFAKDKVTEAVKALQQSSPLQDEKEAKKPSLLPGKETVEMTIVTKKFARQQFKILQCPLPHPFRDLDSTEVCLIIKDVSLVKNFDVERGIVRYKEFLKECGVKGITEVITFKQLRSEYKPYEAKRKLLNRYDMFLVDERLYGKMAQVLGKKFFTKNKFPHRVSLDDALKVASEITQKILSSHLRINGQGPQSTMEIATVEQKPEEIVENVEKVVQFLRTELPGGWDNVRSIYLKYKKVSLPIYVNTDSPNSLPPMKAAKSTGFSTAAEEISTLKEGKVKIERDGSIKVLKPRKKAKNAVKNA